MAVQVVKHSHYRIEVDFAESPGHPVVYFRKEGKCKTFQGSMRQMDRVTNESCDAWRDYNFHRLTVSVVPVEEVSPLVVN